MDPSTPHSPDPRHDFYKKSRKKQNSCNECHRRKQKCDQKVPCNQCIKRKKPHLCRVTQGYSIYLAEKADKPEHQPADLDDHPRSHASPQSSSLPDQSFQHASPNIPSIDSRLSRVEKLLQARARTLDYPVQPTSPHSSHHPASAFPRPKSSLDTRSKSYHRSPSPSLSVASSSSSTNSSPRKRRRYSSSEYIDEDEGFLGSAALDAVSQAPQLAMRIERTPFSLDPGSNGRDPSPGYPLWRANHVMLGVWIPEQEIRAISESLPEPSLRTQFVNVFFARFNWARTKIIESSFRAEFDRITNLSQGQSPTAMFDRRALPSLALALAVLALGSLDNPSVLAVSERSNSLFWASKKCLGLCENLGITSLQSCWAHAVLFRYIDVIRSPRASWHLTGAWVRHAIDMGLHRDPRKLRCSPDERSHRKVMWSHVVHSECEWSLLLGRPMTVSLDLSLAPTFSDLKMYDFAYREYILARNRLVPCLEEIVKFYNPESGATARRELFDAQSYSALLKIDERLVDFAETLPSYFRNVLPGAEADETLDDQHPHLRFYRALVAGTFRFYRTLLHRPFFLQMPAEGEAGRRRRRHPFPRSWNVCLHTALDELRSRRIGNDGLDELERAQVYAHKFTHFNSSIIVGLSLLFMIEAGEKIRRDDFLERLGFVQEFGQVCLGVTRDGAVEKELRITLALLKRLDAATLELSLCCQPADAETDEFHEAVSRALRDLSGEVLTPIGSMTSPGVPMPDWNELLAALQFSGMEGVADASFAEWSRTPI